jgi:uroporphyrin-III C-methyltransferase / precorrin-2 dehydrogenase / sirohydrochlorin ferrochelatase
MRFLPVFFDTVCGVVMLVGSGEAALGKLRVLRPAGAHVRWFSRDADIAEDVVTLPGSGRLEISTGDPLAADLSDIIAVVSAADALDAQIAARARHHRIPVNVVDRPELSTFIFPAIVDRGEVVVAISTGGSSPVLARRLRELIEALLPARIGDLAELIGRHRRRFSAVPRALSARRFWQNVIAGPVADAILAGRRDEAETQLTRAIEASSVGNGDGGNPETVFLVGAGPGDPDLLTLRALHALADADVVFYDELVTPAVLDRARRGAERIFVGKRRGAPGVAQDEINRRLLEAARAGQRVVRLKGGDPFIFGRGGEELDYLRRAGVPVVVVPGITAALGCAAEVGLPLTFRNEASKLTLITAHCADEAAAIDWSGLADPQTTVVVYMGLASAAAVRDGLIAAGRDRATPAAVLARGTRPDAHAALGRLEDLAALAAEAGDGPAILIIGDVVARASCWRAADFDALAPLIAA